MIRQFLAALALMAATAANAAETSCIPPAEAEALGTVLLPDVLTAVAGQCAASLPPTATLRSGLAPLVARWRGESAGASAGAAVAVGRFMGNDLKGGNPDAMLSLVRTAIVNGLAKEVKPASCPEVERLVTLVAPLPAHNIAALFVTVAQLGAAGKSTGDLPICKAAKP